MKNEICGHFLLKTRGNGLEGGVQRIQDGYFAVFRLALDERKILVGVVDSIPPAGGGGSSNLSQEANYGKETENKVEKLLDLVQGPDEEEDLVQELLHHR